MFIDVKNFRLFALSFRLSAFAFLLSAFTFHLPPHLNNLFTQYPFHNQKPESTIIGKITHLTALAA